MNALALFPDVSDDKLWIHDQLEGVLGLVSDHVPEMQVTYRDLAGLVPADALAARLNTFAALGSASHGISAASKPGAQSNQLVAELENAELVVIGAPIGHHPVTPALAAWYRRSHASKGFGAPLYAMGLKPELQAWFSHVIRADRTFRYTAQGPRGLLRGKKALVLAAKIGRWRSDAAAAHQVHCIHTQLRFMGIDEIATIASDRYANPARQPRHWQSPLTQSCAA